MPLVSTSRRPEKSQDHGILRLRTQQACRGPLMVNGFSYRSRQPMGTACCSTHPMDNSSGHWMLPGFVSVQTLHCSRESDFVKQAQMAAVAWLGTIAERSQCWTRSTGVST